jgi:hypothetical protein
MCRYWSNYKNGHQGSKSNMRYRDGFQSLLAKDCFQGLPTETVYDNCAQECGDSVQGPISGTGHKEYLYRLCTETSPRDRLMYKTWTLCSEADSLDGF